MGGLSKRATPLTPVSPQDLRTSYAVMLDARPARDSNRRMDNDAAPARHAPLGPELGLATGAAVAAVLVAMGAERLFGYRDPSLVFITAVLVVSVRTRMSVAIYAAALCFLAYNFFFIHPLYTLYISSAGDVATVLMFLAAALLCGRLANRLRTQVIDLRRANARTRALQKLSEGLAAAGDEAAVAAVATRAVAAAMAAEVVMAALDERSQRLGPTLGQVAAEHEGAVLVVHEHGVLGLHGQAQRRGVGGADVGHDLLQPVDHHRRTQRAVA